MYKLIDQKDEELRQRLYSLSVDDKEYWSFKGNSNREYGHGLFQYPAMMVPQLARTLLAEICSVHSNFRNVGDPFMGSGTILTESKLKGLNFWGADINPLAYLLCKVKSGPYLIDELEAKASELKKNIANENSQSCDISFHNIDKWFRRDVQYALSRLRICIKKENTLWVRRFFWVALAETVRNTSNSRTSTFKLHTRTQEDIRERGFNPVAFFLKTLERNLRLYKSEFIYLKEFGSVDKNNYCGDINLFLGDIRKFSNNRKCDLIITSPPYGDNATTVPYGQYSYLPLQWIELSDIDESISPDILSTTHTIDSASLGGNLSAANKHYEELSKIAPSLESYADSIKNMPKDRLNRVCAFLRDLNQSLPIVLNRLEKNGLMVWVLGNRKVGGKRVPLDKILTELFESYNTTLICRLVRSIPSKRMAIKNSLTQTMSKESIIVLRKN